MSVWGSDQRLALAKWVKFSKSERLRNEAWRDGTTGRGTISTKILKEFVAEKRRGIIA
jgi:hypothetical protein